MTENNDEKIAQIFTGAESELHGEDFRGRVMFNVARQRRRQTVSRYGSWALIFLCFLFIIPMVVRFSFTVGNTMGNLPGLIADSLQPYLDFALGLLIISAVLCYLLSRFHLLRLPSFRLFGRIGIFRLYTQ